MKTAIISIAVFFLVLAFLLEIIKSVKKTKDKKRHASLFYTKQLMNKEEFNLFKILTNLNETYRYGYIFSQVSLGEIIGCKNEKKFYTINSKRIDFLIVDLAGNPLIAIEYQGKGHYQGNYKERDAIKRHAVEEAGFIFLEIFTNDLNNDGRHAKKKIKSAFNNQ